MVIVLLMYPTRSINTLDDLNYYKIIIDNTYCKNIYDPEIRDISFNSNMFFIIINELHEININSNTSFIIIRIIPK